MQEEKEEKEEKKIAPEEVLHEASSIAKVLRLRDVVKRVCVINRPQDKHRWVWVMRELGRVGLDDRVHRPSSPPDALLEGDRAGLTLSHYFCWQEMAYNLAENEVGLVLEDDATFHDDIDVLFHEHWQYVEKPFRICALGCIPDWGDTGNFPVRRGVSYFGTHAYFLDAEGAKYLMAQMPTYFAPRKSICVRDLYNERESKHYDSPERVFRMPIDFILPNMIKHDAEKQRWWAFVSPVNLPFVFRGKKILCGQAYNKVLGSGLCVQNQLLTRHPDNIDALLTTDSLE